MATCVFYFCDDTCIYFQQIENNRFQFFPLRKAKVLVELDKSSVSKSGDSAVATAHKDGNGSAGAN